LATSRPLSEIVEGPAGPLRARRYSRAMVPPSLDPVAASEPASPTAAAPEDVAAVESRLGRRPQGRFAVVVRDATGAPVVIRNEPLLDDGTPMPTRFWLVDPDLLRRIGTLEAAGGVKRAEAAVDATELAEAHRRAAAERDAAIPVEHAGPRPFGGVGGTRTGVKCLHAHYACFLATGDDPVGAWVEVQLSADETGVDHD